MFSCTLTACTDNVLNLGIFSKINLKIHSKNIFNLSIKFSFLYILTFYYSLYKKNHYFFKLFKIN